MHQATLCLRPFCDLGLALFSSSCDACSDVAKNSTTQLRCHISFTFDIFDHNVLLRNGTVAQRGGNNITYRHGRDFARNSAEACLRAWLVDSSDIFLRLGNAPSVDRFHCRMSTGYWNNLLVDRPMTVTATTTQTTMITGTYPNQN